MAQEGDGGGSPKWDSALTEDALKVVPSNVISLVDGAPAQEKEQLMNRIQVLAAERYDALARAFFQRRWAAASLAALQDYQERAANVRFTESVEKLVDEWAASQPAVRAPKGEGSASRGGRQRRQPKRSAAATTGPAASTGTEAGSAASSRWTYAHKSPLEFALSPVETLADLKAMHIDWKVRARKFATLPTRPDIPVEVKRDSAALGRSSAARVPPGVASGNVLHIAGQVLTPGDDVVIVATLSAEEFVARLLRVTHAEAVVGLPDGSKARIPTLHLRRGRFTMTKLATPGLPSLGPANDSPATPAPPPTSAAPPSLPPAPASQASATTTSSSQGHPPRTTSGPPPSSQTPPSSSAAGGLTPAVQAAMEAAARAGGALAPPLASGGTKRVREVGGGGGQAKRPRSGSSGSHVV